MADQTVSLRTNPMDAHDIATELTKAMIEQKLLCSVDDAVNAYQEFFNTAIFASTNQSNPFE